MKTNTRFIQSVVKSSKSTDVVMPWARGENRITTIASRVSHKNNTRAKGV
ncbi:MAG: hypothetical protein ACI92Z_001564 [Paracoccaceae bacterium]|jgi:hypothetical protein